MKKTIGLFVAGIACFWGLSACGTTHSTTTTSTSTASHTQKKAESLIVNGVEMTLTDFGEKHCSIRIKKNKPSIAYTSKGRMYLLI